MKSFGRTKQNENCFSRGSSIESDPCHSKSAVEENFVAEMIEYEYPNNHHQRSSSHLDIRSTLVEENGRSVTLRGSKNRQIHRPQGRTFLVSNETYNGEIRHEKYDRDPMEIPFLHYVPSEDSRENNSILTQDPISSEDNSVESLIFDTNIISLPNDLLEDNDIAKLRMRRCYFLILALLLMISLSIGVSLFMTRKSTPSSTFDPVPTRTSCSINHILHSCLQNWSYQVEIPTCASDRYQKLRTTFRNELDLKFYPKGSCSAYNLAFLSVATSETDSSTYYNSTVLQRFGLSLLYFATRGREWNNQKDWISDASYCQWGSSHVVCSSEGFVKSLILVANNLQGTLPSNLLTFLPRLKYLNVEGNSLRGTIPSDLSVLSNLVMDNNALSGNLPMSIVESTNMQILSISQNRAIVINRYNPFFNGSQWRYLSLGRIINAPSGAVPSEISKLTNLRHLDMSFSSMTGTLPSELGLLKKLTSLDISGNNLEGTIPSEIGNLNQLHSLTLYMNQLSGTIPSEIGTLIRMNHIYLDSNSLQGVIPREVCLLVNLVELSLSYNKLTGQLPYDIGKLTNLKVLKFVPNNFNGVIPMDLCILKTKGNLITLGISNSVSCVKNLSGLLCPDSIPNCCNNVHINCTT
jgi:Leucine-rich repeat (LRR) protein